MAQAAWGTKRRCFNCGAGYYDLNKDPIVCPKCDAPYQPGLQRKRVTAIVPLRGRLRRPAVDEREPAEDEAETEAEHADEEAEGEGERVWTEDENDESREDKGY